MALSIVDVFHVLLVVVIFVSCILVLRVLGHTLHRRTVRSLQKKETKPAPKKKKPIVVRTENEVLAAISDVYACRTDNYYVVRIDATKWNVEDRMNAMWLKTHPSRRVKIEQMKF